MRFCDLSSFLKPALLATIPICAMACQPAPTGLAGAGEGYARHVSALYDEPAVNHAPRSIEFPINVAVAQVGKAAPYEDLLKKLRAAPDVFHRVASLPADTICTDRNAAPLREALPRLQAMARDQGADYVLIFGTTVDPRTRVTAAAGLDLTIIGAFIVPSREIEADASASAALVDVRSGTIVLTGTSQGASTLHATLAAIDAERDRAEGKSAEISLLNLGDQIVRDARQRLADENIAATK